VTGELDRRSVRIAPPHVALCGDWVAPRPHTGRRCTGLQRRDRRRPSSIAPSRSPESAFSASPARPGRPDVLRRESIALVVVGDRARRVSSRLRDDPRKFSPGLRPRPRARSPGSRRPRPRATSPRTLTGAANEKGARGARTIRGTSDVSALATAEGSCRESSRGTARNSEASEPPGSKRETHVEESERTPGGFGVSPARSE